MDTVPLGATNVRVSEVCLGTDYYGSRVLPARAFELLDQFADAGGTFLDTSNIYACWIPGFEGGESEGVIGDWMAERRCRERMFVGTKVGLPYQASHGGLRASEIEHECEKSLRRLRSDWIDLYFTHCDDRATPLEEILDAFTSLRSAGKIRFVGISNWYLWRLAEARLVAEAHDLAVPVAAEFRTPIFDPLLVPTLVARSSPVLSWWTSVALTMSRCWPTRCSSTVPTPVETAPSGLSTKARTALSG